MRLAAVLAALGLAACGRLSFDDQEQSLAPLESELRVIAGATSIDVEVCATRAARVRTAVSTTPWPTAWDAAYLDARIMADEVLPQAGCTTSTHAFTTPETALYAYTLTDVESTGEVDQREATATLQPMLVSTAFAVAGNHTQRYWLHYPESYYRDPTAPLPVLVFTGGMGEDGDDTGSNLDLLKTRGLLAPFTQRSASVVDLPFLVIAPQCNTDRASCWGWIGHEAFLDEVIDHVRTTVTFDEQRVYVTGLSTGGEGAFRFAIHSRRRAPGSPGVVVAAAVPISSTYTNDAFYVTNMCAIAAVPTWAFHNTDDPTQPVTNSRTFVTRLNGCPQTAGAQLDEGTGGHNAWSRVYSDGHTYANGGMTSIYSWLLAQTL